MPRFSFNHIVVAADRLGGEDWGPSFRIQDLMLRVAPTKYSANALEGYPIDYIRKGSIFGYGPFNCTYGSGMYSRTREIWCRVNFQHDGVTTNGWVSAHFLRDNYGNLLACRYATDDPQCIDPRRNR